MRYPWLLMLAAGVSGCLSVPDKLPCDEDQDGYLAAACVDERDYPPDCDDRLATVFPGAYDEPDNDLDEDCAGAITGLTASVSIPALSYERKDLVERITSATLDLTFESQRGFEPTDLRIRGGRDANLLYTDELVGERYFGVAIYPEFYQHTGFRAATPTYFASNRAVVRFAANWTVGDTVERANGTTHYTVHPDGRIHVDQDVDVLSNLSDPPGSHWLANYIALDPTHIDRIRPLGQPTRTIGLSPGTIYEPTTPNQGYICAWSDNYRDRLIWVYQAPADQTPIVGPRAVETGLMTDSFHRVAMQFDWIRAGDVATGKYRANVMVRADLAGDEDPCEGGLGVARFLHSPPILSVAGPAYLVTNTPGDDDVDGYNEGGGFYVIDAGDLDALAIRITDSGASVAPTAMLRITGLEWTRPPLVSLDGVRLEHGRDYLAELDTDGDGGWLFVNRPLPNDSTLTLREAAPYVPNL